MNILHIIYDDINNPWLGGGGAIRAFEINKRLVSAGDKVTMLVGNFPNSEKLSSYNGVQILKVGYSSNYLMSRISFSLFMNKFIYDLDFDLLVEDTSPFNFIRSYAKIRKPLVAIVHQITGKMLLKKFKVMGLIPYYWEKYNIGRFDNIITDSDRSAEIIKEKYRRMIYVCTIHNGVDNILLQSQPEEENYMLFLGRLEIFQKGLDILLEAFKLIARRHSSIKLLVAGSGKDRLLVEKKIRKLDLSPQVKLIGRISGKEKIDYLRKCLFCVMPSRYEGWPVVAIEASACAKPVIGTNIDGFMNAVFDNETGLLAQLEDVSSFAFNMERLINDSSLRRRLGTNAREWAKRFTWDIITKKQREIYEKIIKKT